MHLHETIHLDLIWLNPPFIGLDLLKSFPCPPLDLLDINLMEWSLECWGEFETAGISVMSWPRDNPARRVCGRAHRDLDSRIEDYVSQSARNSTS